jgi:hypothetical protein
MRVIRVRTIIILSICIFAFVTISGCAVYNGTIATNTTARPSIMPTTHTTSGTATAIPASFPIAEGSGDIVITQPVADNAANKMIRVKGYLININITSINVDLNGAVEAVAVSDSNFSTTLNLSKINNVTISAVGPGGKSLSTTMLLDGDRLPASYERLCGFDPLNPDSDSIFTPENESGNGILDGDEILNKNGGEMLPAVTKYIFKADPLKVDSNGNGLTDCFELEKLGIMDVSSNSSEERALPGEDPDHDGLTNIEEQRYGTYPLIGDTDGDGLTDGREVNVYHTDPRLQDTDHDGLDDASEIKLGADPLDPDTNHNGVLDGNETYTSSLSDNQLGVEIRASGKGDISKKMRIYEEKSEYYTNVSSRTTTLVGFTADTPLDSARVIITYDPQSIKDPSNLAVFYFNESCGMYLPLDTVVDTINNTIGADVPGPCMFAGFDAPGMARMYDDIGKFNGEIAAYMPSPAQEFTVDGDITITIRSKGSNGAITTTSKTLKII